MLYKHQRQDLDMITLWISAMGRLTQASFTIVEQENKIWAGRWWSNATCRFSSCFLQGQADRAQSGGRGLGGTQKAKKPRRCFPCNPFPCEVRYPQDPDL